jgi:hypothetical protein
MVPPTWRWLLATTAVALVAVTGCSSPIGGSASAPGSAGTGGSAAGAGSSGGGGDGACGSESGFCITVNITGAATLQGTAQSINLGTCADFAKGGSPDGGLRIPGFLGEDIGGKKVSSANEIREYAGPGTYETDALRSVAGVLDVSIDNTPYQAADNTTAQAVIKADGSGSFTFADLKEGEQGNAGTAKGAISGSFTWTCSD